MWGTVSHCSTATQYLFVGWKKCTYIHDPTYSNREDIDTLSNAPYLSGGFVPLETMAYTPRCTVLLFEKQWFGGWPGCMLGPECRSPRRETKGQGEEFSDEGEKLWDGGQRKSVPTPRFGISRGSCHGPVQHGAVSHTPLLSEVRSRGAEENLLQAEYRKELVGLHLIIRQWKHPPRHGERPMPFTVSWANMPVEARIVRYLRTIFNWTTDANVSRRKRLRRKRNNVGRK